MEIFSAQGAIQSAKALNLFDKMERCVGSLHLADGIIDIVMPETLKHLMCNDNFDNFDYTVAYQKRQYTSLRLEFYLRLARYIDIMIAQEVLNDLRNNSKCFLSGYMLYYGFKICIRLLILCNFKFCENPHHYTILPWMIELEKGVVACRDVIVVLLGLKKRRQILKKLDRFLVRDVLAVEIWTTRGDVDWQR